MPRPREFDREEVLDQAIEVFWQRGYEAASIQDLVDHMGIQRGSLYGAFGDKHGLFLAALDRYEEVFYSRVLAKLETSGSPRAAIQRVFEDVARECACEDGRKGCLMTNTAVELSTHDDETAERVAANFSRLENGFFQALVAARAKGEIGEEPGARALSRFLTNSFQGLRVMGKACPDRALLRDVVRVTLSALN
jgi:TetR/AcrR family transcriptional repressor of nem operon